MQKFKILPLTNRVLVQVDNAQDKSKEGIYIPDTAKGSPQRGTILAVGNGKKNRPMTVKVGDIVLYGKYSGSRITVEGVEALIMKESDIFGIIQLAN